MRAAWLKSAGGWSLFSSGVVSDRRSAGSCTDKFITAFFIGLYPSFGSTDGLRAENNLISKLGNCLDLQSSQIFLSISATTYCFALNFSVLNDYLMTVLFQNDACDVYEV